MLKRIIVISELFAPDLSMGAVRPTKLAKYLKIITGAEICVITQSFSGSKEDENQARDLAFVDELIEIKKPKLFNWIRIFREILANRRRTKIRLSSRELGETYKGVGGLMAATLRYSLYLIDSFVYFLAASREINHSSFTPDMIISTYGPLSSHYIGRSLKKKFPSAKWIMDFRDPVYVHEVPWVFAKYAKNYAHRVGRYADEITVVSDGYVSALHLEQNSNVSVIMNGYDLDDKCEVDFSYIPHKSMLLTYVGALYNGRRDLGVLFKIVRELLDDGYIEKGRITFRYAGTSKDDFEFQIRKHRLSDSYEAQGQVSRTESIKMQLESDILLVATWNEPNELGVVPGKLLEYYMMNKPIIGIVSGAKSESMIKKMINTGNLGFCYEEANDTTDRRLLKEYILHEYRIFLSDGMLLSDSKAEYVKEFDYRNIARQFLSLYQKRLPDARKNPDTTNMQDP